MCYKKYFFLLWVLMLYLSAPGQCPFRDSLWGKINQLASKSISDDSQLNELLILRNGLIQCKTSRDSADAFLYHRIGILYYKMKDYRSSVSNTLLAIEILDALEKRNLKYPGQKFRGYRNLTIYYDSLEQTAKKNEAVDSCIAISLSSNYADSLILYPICERIVSLFNIGDYTRCIRYASLGRELAEKYGYTNTSIIQRIFAWKINSFILLNNYPAVAAELKNKIQEYEHSKNYYYIGNLYASWGDYYRDTGKFDSALSCYKKSFQFHLKMNNKATCAPPLDGIGFIYDEYLHDYPKALYFYFKALSFSDSKESISILSNIGNVYAKRHQFDSAFYYYQHAFDQIHPGMNEFSLLDSVTDKTLNNMAEYIASLVLDKADVYLYQFKGTGKISLLKQALESYKTADQVLDKIKQSQFELQSKLTWRKNIRRLYEHAIEAGWLAKDPEKGFYFFEKSRAVLLDDQLKQDRLMQNNEVLEQYKLKTAINQLENELDTTNTLSDKYSKLQAEIISKKEEQDRLSLKINAKDPLFFARNSGTETINIRDVQNTIFKDHSALVEIFNGDSSLFTLTITGSESRMEKIGKRSFDSLSRRFLSFISNSRLINTQFPDFTNTSGRLYELIFSDHPLPKGRVIISPDGICIPFEALIVAKGPDPRYMLSDYSISYTYSARFLMSEFSNSSSQPSTDFMGMAPVDYAPYLNLTSLPGSDNSMNRIRSHFSNTYTSMGPSASKNNFLLNFPNNRIVQIYSHASYNDLEGKPFIYFADSSLDLSELFSKERPTARLIVLSACETALGKEYKGEGVFSFSREFAALGIPASISNIWSVDNEATYRITELFYQFISEGQPTDIALQQAKLKYITGASREKGLPYYWAAPILTGKTETIKTRTAFPFQYVVLFLSVVGIFIWVWYRLKNPRI